MTEDPPRLRSAPPRARFSPVLDPTTHAVRSRPFHDSRRLATALRTRWGTKMWAGMRK